MRMWNVEPELMCRQHLLGEHVEMHMFASCLNKNINLQGYVDGQLVELGNIKNRHNELVKEMKKRGYKHNSEIGFVRKIEAGYVDKDLNKLVLRERCKECKKLQNESK